MLGRYLMFSWCVLMIVVSFSVLPSYVTSSNFFLFSPAPHRPVQRPLTMQKPFRNSWGTEDRRVPAFHRSVSSSCGLLDPSLLSLPRRQGVVTLHRCRRYACTCEHRPRYDIVRRRRVWPVTSLGIVSMERFSRDFLSLFSTCAFLLCGISSRSAMCTCRNEV